VTKSGSKGPSSPGVVEIQRPSRVRKPTPQIPLPEGAVMTQDLNIEPFTGDVSKILNTPAMVNEPSQEIVSQKESLLPKQKDNGSLEVVSI
jgi:hypothetical protein